MIQGNLREYFACANSALGFVNYFSDVLLDLDRIYILKGGPGCGKSTLMGTISGYFLARGEPVSHILCSSDPHSLDGVILEDKKIAVVDGTAPHVIEPLALGALEEYINLGDCLNHQALTPHKEEILSLQEEIRNQYRNLYQALRQAKDIHGRKEAIYLEQADFYRLDMAAQTMIDTTFADIPPKDVVGRCKHRFFGTLTPQGMLHRIESLTDFCKTRYFLQGRPGTGKSTLLKKLADATIGHGYSAEVYHCGFDPDSLDMVIVPDLGLAAFDATSPHEVFPSKESDILLDLYETGIRAGTEEENHEILALLSRSYRDKLNEAQGFLARAKELHDDLESIYYPAVDFAKMDRITQTLIRKITATPYGNFLR